VRQATLRLAVAGLLLLTGAALRAADPPPIVEVREPDSPFVAFNIWIRSGSAADPRGKEGLASLTAALLANGATMQDSYEAVLEKLYPFAADYSAQVDKDMTVFTGRVHRDNLDAFYALFRNALLSPAFREDDFSRLKARRLNAVERARRYSRDEELSKELLFWAAFRGTPYEHPVEGYVSSVRAITIDDVKAFHAAHYRRGNVVVGLGGGYPAGFPERVRRDMNTLPEGDVRAPAVPAAAQPDRVKAIIVEKQTDASAISLGFPISVLRNDPDFVPLLIANSYLGEHRNPVGRLYQQIREVRGMNYGNYAYIEAFPAGYATQQPRLNVARSQQLFEIWIRPISMTAPGNLHDRALFATRAALHELDTLVRDGLTTAQVAASKEFLRNYVRTWGTTLNRRLGYAIDDAFYGIEAPGYLQSLPAAIDKTTPEQVNAAIKKHLQATNFHLVVITQGAEAFKQKLLRGAATPITYAGERSADVAAADKVIASWPIRVRAEDITILPIEKVLD
jgi:zinc protease